MSDPGYLDDVSFRVVSALLIAAYVLHSNAVLSPTVKARVMQLLIFYFAMCVK